MKTYYKDNDGSMLMHSDTYLGEDYISDNLYHWKYLKKEKKNGRWVYYYQDKEADKWEREYQRRQDNKQKEQALKNKNIKNNEIISSGNKEIEAYNNSNAFQRFIKNKYITKVKKKNDKAVASNKKIQEEYLNLGSTDTNMALVGLNSARKKNIIRKTIAKFLVKQLNSMSNAIYKGKKRLKKLFK